MARRKKTMEPTVKELTVVEQPVEFIEEKPKRRRKKVEPTVEEPQAEEIVMPGNPDTAPVEPSQESLECLGEIFEQSNNLPEPQPQPQPQPEPTVLDDPAYYAYLRNLVVKDHTERCMKRLSMGVKMIDHDKEYYVQFDEIVGFNAFVMHQTAETCDIVAIKRIDDNGHTSMFSMQFDAAQYIAKILTERMYVMSQTINSFIVSLPQFRKFESILKVDIESQLEPIVIK